MAPTLLTEILTELQKTLRGKVSEGLLLPATAATVVLVFIHGWAYGWEWYAEVWSAAGVVERFLLVAATLFGFLLVVFALDALTPLVNRLFLGGVWGWRIIWRQAYRKRWDHHKRRTEEWEAASNAFSRLFPPRGKVEAQGAEDPVLAPDASWWSGMVNLSISFPASSVPRELKVGSIIDLRLRFEDSRGLVPGGLLVRGVSDASGAVGGDDGSEGHRQVTLAIPPEDVAKVASLSPNRLVISTRIIPAATPLWKPDQPWTRRWINAIAGATDPDPGDLIRLAHGKKSVQATFCERVGDRWIVALRLGDVPVSPWLRGSDSETVAWEIEKEIIPTASGDIQQWSNVVTRQINPLPVEVLRGRVTIGRLRYASGELFLTEENLRNRYTLEEVKSGLPFSRRLFNPDGPPLQLKVWNSAWAQLVEPETLTIGRFCHFQLSCEPGPTTVVFNCRLLSGQDGGWVVAMPDDIPLTDSSRILFANAKGALRDAPSLSGEGVPFCWKVTEREIEVERESQLQYGSCLVFVPNSNAGDVSSQHDNTMSPAQVTAPDRATANPVEPLAIPGIVRSTDQGDGKRKVLVPEEFEHSEPDSWRFKNHLSRPLDDIRSLIEAPNEERARDAAWKVFTMVDVANKHLQLDADSQLAKQTWEQAQALEREMRQAVQHWVDQSRAKYKLYFPQNRNQVVATRFGNIIQTIESYGHEIYGMHTPVMLARIIKLVDDKTRGPYTAAQERATLLQWSLISALVIAVGGPAMLIHSGAPWLQPLMLYLIAGVAVPAACLQGLTSTGLAIAGEAEFLMDSQRGLVFDALGIQRPKADSAQALQTLERDTWMDTAQWLEYGTDDYRINFDKQVTYQVPPVKADSGPAKEPKEAAT